MSKSYTLWGRNRLYASNRLIKITGGTLAECRQEEKWRLGDGGWTELAIYQRERLQVRDILRYS